MKKVTSRLKRGFTLIELLVVIAIIGLLSSIVLASLSSARQKAKNAAYLAELKQFITALKLYRDDNNGNYPTIANGDVRTNTGSWPSSLNVLVPDYIPSLPIHPDNSSVTYTRLYINNQNGLDYACGYEPGDTHAEKIDDTSVDGILVLTGGNILPGSPYETISTCFPDSGCYGMYYGSCIQF